MQLTKWFVVIVVTIVISVFIVMGSRWFNQEEDYVLLEIKAPRNRQLMLPVFAQFTVTQLIRLPQLAAVAALNVPLYVSDRQGSLRVEIRQRDRLIQRWHYYPENIGLTEAVFEVAPPVLLEGDIEIVFSAPQIGHAQRHLALGLFVETAGNYYPTGHYRVADNDKEGDVGLAVVGRQLKSEDWLKAWKNDLRGKIIKLNMGILLLLLMVSFPMVLRQRWNASILRK